MCPSLARDDQTYVRGADAELGADLTMGITRCHHLADGCNIVVCEFRLGILDPGGRPAFRLAISHIGLLRPEKKMIGIDARRSITAVKNFSAMRQRAAMNLPRCTMGEHVRPAIARAYFTVTLVVQAAVPKPAIIGFVNKSPEALLDRPRLHIATASTRVPVPPHANSVAVAKTGIAARRLAAIWNAAYRFFSHFDLLERLAWLERAVVVRHPARSLFVADFRFRLKRLGAMTYVR